MGDEGLTVITSHSADISIMAYRVVEITLSFRLSCETGQSPFRRNSVTYRASLLLRCSMNHINDFHNKTNKENIVIAANNFGNITPLAGGRRNPVV